MLDKTISHIADHIIKLHGSMPAKRSLLAGISGIDGSGKGYFSQKVDGALRASGLRTALITVDDWLELPDVRFCNVEPGMTFYEKGLRLDEMFDRLVLPLQRDRSIRLSANLTRETAAEHHEHTYLFKDIDVILVEGIFLFKPRFARHFDLKVWINCSFDTALKRACDRRQEGLDQAGTVKAYETIYWPAQAIHLDRDHPVSAADTIIEND